MNKSLIFLICILHEMVDIKCIIGGRNAAEGEFPYQVFIKIANNCGGAILGPRYILTTGSCTAKGLSVFIGRINPSNGGIKIEIEEVIRHPLFAKDYYHYNIALLRTSEDIVYTEYIKPVKLPEFNEQIYGLTKANVTGWGRMSGGEVPKILQYLQTETANKIECKKYFKYEISDNLICTFIPEKGLCGNSDEASPLVHDNQVIGIGSNVFSNCGKMPDVYINIYQFKDWIESVMNHGSTSHNTNMMQILFVLEIFVIVLTLN